MSRERVRLRMVVCVVLGPVVGCAPFMFGDDGSTDAMLPDFSIVDVNPNSARYQRSVSPRDYLGQVSAWYFGHST